jgi:hypothetical protein
MTNELRLTAHEWVSIREEVSESGPLGAMRGQSIRRVPVPKEPAEAETKAKPDAPSS